MKNVFLITALITLSSLFAYTQNIQEPENYKKTIELFVKHYNNSEPQKIFDLYSKDLKRSIPLQQTEGFFNNLKPQIGSFSAAKFTGFSELNPQIARYKVKTAKGLFLIQIAVNNSSELMGYQITPYNEEDKSIPKPERNTSSMSLPFDGDWYVVWGGDTKELNYHVDFRPQKNAFDFVMLNGTEKSFKTNGEKNEDYYCFGQKLFAPCDGEVFLAVDGVRDNKPGVMNASFPMGNTVVIKTKNDEFVYLCHFKQHSVAVKQGQEIKKGDFLGLCGNSGNSSEAHLHFHIQNTGIDNVATGIKCYFDALTVNGKAKKDYSPIQQEIISR